MDPSSGWNSVSYAHQNPKLFDEIKSPGWCFGFDPKGYMQVSHSHPTNLMQNCDLPPPIKIFSGGDKPVDSIKPKQHASEGGKEELLPISKSVDQSDKLELMKALQLSQSRARTAEKKASLMAEEKDKLSTLLLRESLRLFAHQQWMKLLQQEVSQLQSQKVENQVWCSSCSKTLEREKGSSEAEDSEKVGNLTWCVTVALCLSFAGVGMAVGCKHLF